MRSFLYLAVVAVAVPLAIILIPSRIGRASPAVLDGERGAIAPDKWSAAITIAGGTALAAVGAFVVAADDPLAGAFVVLLGGAIAAFMVPSLTTAHTVTWTERAIEGPSKRFGPTLGAARTEIAWHDIVRTGRVRSGYWFVEACDGRRVYWSHFYRGHPALAAALRRHRPGLERAAGL